MKATDETIELLWTGKFTVIEKLIEDKITDPTESVNFKLSLENDWYPNTEVWVPLHILIYIMSRFDEDENDKRWR
jgi:hypothetical protein